MSTETIHLAQQDIDNTDVVKKDQLQTKYIKYKIFGHWIISRIAEKINNLDKEKLMSLDFYEFMMNEHCIYSSVKDQTAYFQSFFDENPKFSLKDINKEVRKHNKPLKQNKNNNNLIDSPKKKRGRKKKVIENIVSEEEQYIANIVALQDSKIEEPVLVLESPQIYHNTIKLKKSKVIDENKPKRKYTKKNKLQEKPLLEEPLQEKPLQEKPLQEELLQEEPLLEEPLQEKPLQEELLQEEPLLEEPLQEKPLQKEPLQEKLLQEELHQEDNIIVSNSFQSLYDAVKELQDDDEFIPFEYNNQQLLINKFLHIFDYTATNHIASLSDSNIIFH